MLRKCATAMDTKNLLSFLNERVEDIKAIVYHAKGY